MALLGIVAALALDTAVAAPGALLGWNNLGMHCMDSDYSVFSILPPYNTIEAQLLVNGQLVTSASGYTVTYQAIADPSGSINSTSIGKGNFNTYTPFLYGAVAADMGLAGWSMPGLKNTPQGMLFEAGNQPAAGVATPVNWFRAEGIPISPYDNAMRKNEYPMMRLTARNSAGAVVATSDIVLPVSDEMDCRACHASGTQTAARPAAGWTGDPNPERDYRLNILSLHDERQFTSHAAEYSTALSSRGFNPAGLLANVVNDGKPILCAACHVSEALQGSGLAGIPPLTAAIHGLHAGVMDPVLKVTLDNSANRAACYRCHPGSTTKCLRGAMGSAIAPDGSMEMQCQSCHGSMSQVGSPSRVGWFMEPNCQSCHTGTATRNNGQIRYTSVFTDANGTVRVPVDQTFATTPNTPAPGLSLYRFSVGHGGLQCSACHGSTHAEFPSSHPNDNVRNVELQGHAGVTTECTACHASMPNTVSGGPHGMHPIGADWVNQHHDMIERSGLAQCQSCHGLDLRGTVLSRAQGERTFNVFGTERFFRGASIGCYTCHNGPDEGDANPSAPPTVKNVSTTTLIGQPVAMLVPVTGANAVLRVISQPVNGSVGLVNDTATYFPNPGFTGSDTFTFAAYDGAKNSVLGTGTIVVTDSAVPPVITAQPTSRTVLAGGNVSFSVTATGTAPLAYQWRKAGVNVPGATSSTLTLTGVTAASAGSYSVVVSNAAGSVTSNPAVLTVTQPPITISLTSPSSGATYISPADVRLAASVSPVSSVARVDFLDGSTVVGSVSVAPFTLTTRSLAVGVHTLRARAISKTGGTSTSSPVQITVLRGTNH